MAKGFPGMGGNMNNLLKQAQKMQKDMEKNQKELETKVYEASAGGGAVSVKLTGKKRLESVTIDKDVVDPDDVEMLQDLIVAAVNEAMGQADQASSDAIGKMTGGLGLGGGLGF